MKKNALNLVTPPRPFAGAAVLCAALACSPLAARAAEPADPHQDAIAALGDLDAAVAEIDQASALSANSPDPYRQAAHRAINALVGEGAAAYDDTSGNPGDSEGALGHLNALAGGEGSPAWLPAVRTALVNATVAENRLASALDTDGLDEYQSATTGALESLLVALGRSSDAGPLGGLHGALSTSALGVPSGATVIDGCAVPSKAPAYGVTGGRLLYVTVSPDAGSPALPEPLAVTSVTSQDGITVLHTASADVRGSLCKGDGAGAASHASLAGGGSSGTTTASKETAAASASAPAAGGAAAGSASADQAASASSQSADTDSGSGDQTSSSSAAADPASGGGANLPKLYTEAQAKQGADVFAQQCASCHGAQLQGKSAPAIAGDPFLKKAKLLDWSVADLRHIVVTSMPRSNPGSLSKQQYADVLAYLLAVDCYPAGKQLFPKDTSSDLQNAKLHPVAAKPSNKDFGTCAIKVGG